MKQYTRNTYGDKETTGSATEAMRWHRNGDAVTVTRGGVVLAVIAGAARKERDADRDWEHCRRIAWELEAYAAGQVYRCPDCGRTIHAPDDMGDKYRCPDCGQVHDVDNLESLGIWDYMEDILDIEYRCGSDREYRSVQIMVACGGPNIYIDTASKAVELYWWGEKAKYWLNSDAVAAVDEWAEEYWRCL